MREVPLGGVRLKLGRELKRRGERANAHRDEDHVRAAKGRLQGHL